MATRAVAYIRVSTDDQVDKGVSLDAQRARVTAYAAQHGLELVEIVEGAGESAKSLDRPGLQRALELLRGADALLIVTLDRLTRSVRDWGVLLEEYFTDRAQLLSTQEHVDTSTASGRFVLNILFAKAQYEREQIGDRTAAALSHKSSLGEFTGGAAPYGFTVGVGGKLEPAAAEQLVITEAQRLRASGLSLERVGAELALAGYRTRTGAVFNATQVRRMLARATKPD